MKKIFLFLSVFFCFAASALAADVETIVAQGKLSYEQGNYQQAAILFNKAILAQPDRADVFLYSAKAWVEMGNYQQAIDDLDECIRLNPNAIESYCIRSYLLQLTGENEKAVLDINKLMAVYPENVMLYYVRALLYEQSGEFEKAIEDYTYALKINKLIPKNKKQDELLLFAEVSDAPLFDKEGAILYYGRAMAQSKNGNFTEAKKDFKRAAKLNAEFLDDVPEGVIG